MVNELAKSFRDGLYHGAFLGAYSRYVIHIENLELEQSTYRMFHQYVDNFPGSVIGKVEYGLASIISIPLGYVLRIIGSSIYIAGDEAIDVAYYLRKSPAISYEFRATLRDLNPFASLGMLIFGACGLVWGIVLRLMRDVLLGTVNGLYEGLVLGFEKRWNSLDNWSDYYLHDFHCNEKMSPYRPLEALMRFSIGIPLAVVSRSVRVLNDIGFGFCAVVAMMADQVTNYLDHVVEPKAIPQKVPDSDVAQRCLVNAFENHKERNAALKLNTGITEIIPDRSEIKINRSSIKNFEGKPKLKKK